MELKLKNLEDINKLEGWTVKGVSLGKSNGIDPCLHLVMTHPAAEKPIGLTIIASVQFGRSGNVNVTDAVLSIKAEDIQPS